MDKIAEILRRSRKGISTTDSAPHIARRKGGFSVVFIVLAIVLLILFGITFWNKLARDKLERTNTMRYNLRQLYKAIIIYSEEYDNYLPSANHWCDLLMNNNKTLSRANFRHPKSQDSECSVAFNTNLGDQRLADLPLNTVLLFEAEGKWNLTGTSDLLKKRDRHLFSEVLLLGGDIETFRHKEDGIMRYDADLDETSIEPLRWKP